MNISAWLRQPTTIKGIGAVLGVIIGAVAQLASHDVTISGAVLVVVYGIVHIILPDNSGAQSSVGK